ncbi:MAG: glucosaminidase domain-containing protein [Bacteroidota bacterium]|jgi:LysM repeat protein
MRKLAFIFILFFVSTFTIAQRITVEQYIDMYKEFAMEEMLRSGVPASITLAQGILEAEYGNSRLAKEANNHFGIKCKETWTGPTIRHTDDAPWECFRKYGTAEESYRDHSEFLRTRKHYAFLFDLDIMDYKSWAYGLKKAGYATNPKYPVILIGHIEKYNLHEYSVIAMKRKDNPQYVSVNHTDTSLQTKKPQVNDVVVEKTIENTQVKPSYPEGVFEINNTKVVYAKAGTPWMVIADQYKVALHHLFDFNELNEQETVEQDQLVFLKRKRKKGSVEYHTVREGETLHSIAQSEGIRLSSLLDYNHLSSDKTIFKGKILFLQSEAPLNGSLSDDKKGGK